MIGEHDAAKPLFEKHLEKKISNSQKVGLLLGYALCLQSLKDQKALVVANEVVRLEPKTARAMQAQAIIIEMKKDADGPSKLRRIEKNARKNGHSVIANNLALNRITIKDDYSSSLRLVHKTAYETGDFYNAARAAVKLGKFLIKESKDLTDNDLKNLINAYQYFYGERRTPLFLEAHTALWIYFNNRGEIKNLLTLFRHGSFIWRLHDDEDNEKYYIQQLIVSAKQILSTKILTADKNTAYFLMRAQKNKIEDDA